MQLQIIFPPIFITILDFYLHCRPLPVQLNQIISIGPMDELGHGLLRNAQCQLLVGPVHFQIKATVSSSGKLALAGSIGITPAQGRKTGYAK